MDEKQPKLIPYEYTLYDLLIKEAKGKYLQNIIAPHLIAQIPEKNELNMHYIDEGQLSVWFPLLKRWGDISLEEFSRYAIITEEQFNDYKKNNDSLQNIVLAHKDAPIFKKGNKPNLSAQKVTHGKFFGENVKRIRNTLKDF